MARSGATPRFWCKVRHDSDRWVPALLPLSGSLPSPPHGGNVSLREDFKPGLGPAAALVLEVKGDFCHGVRAILESAGRGEDDTQQDGSHRMSTRPAPAVPAGALDILIRVCFL